MIRDKRPPEELRGKLVSTRLTPALRDALEAKALEQGKTLSAYLRDLIARDVGLEEQLRLPTRPNWVLRRMRG